MGFTRDYGVAQITAASSGSHRTFINSQVKGPNFIEIKIQAS